MLSSHEEYAFSLNQYMVVLEKPIGLTLAPDPATGDVYVQEIQEGLSAAESRLVLVGDKLLLCSAVFGDEMWRASDLQRTRWAINNRPGKVKLVLERSNGEPLPAWYFRGREGVATWEVPELQLPIRFVTPVGGELSESVAGAGRCLSVSFSRCLSPVVLPADQARRSVRRGAAARRARAEAMLAQLAAAAEAPDMELPNPVVRLLPGQPRFQVGGAPGSPLPASSQNVLPFRRPPQQPQPQQHNAAGGSPLAAPPGSNNVQPPQSNSNSSSSNSSSNSSGGSVSAGGEYVPVRQQNSSSSQQQQQQQQPPAAGEAAAAAAAASPPSNGGASSSSSSSRSGPGPGRKVIQLLPWLLVSHGRLSGPELVHLAASRALTCLLELGLRLEPETGLLSPRGASPPAYEPAVLPVPPTLSPSSIPTPAPANPPPFPPGQQQQQQEAAAAAAAAAAETGQQQQQGDGQGEAGDRQGEGEREGDGGGVPGLLVAAGLAGIAGPDTGFASAAVAAAAAAAAVEAGAEAAERQQQDGGNAGSSSSSSSSGDSSGDAAGQQPSYVTLQAHHLLYCMADLQRLAVRRHWMRRRSASSSSSSSSSGLPLQPPLQQHFQQQQPPQQQQQQQQHYGSQLLLTCDEGSWPAVGLLLAAWLHWHCSLELAVAVEAVGGALGVTLDTSVLAEARLLLVVRAKERFSRLLLTWPYGGLSAEVSGELLGGWTERVAMKRCLKPEGCLGVAQGHFYLELAGLHPGRYHYKYIIDNTWAVDPLAPKALDSQGNWNNVLEVAPPPAIATPQEQEHFAALQAACAAFEAKAAPPRRRQQ